MAKKMKVCDIVSEMDQLGPGVSAYLNKRSGEIVAISEEEASELERDDFDNAPEWMREMRRKLKEATESEDWIPLPDSSDIHEWEIMRGFAASVGDKAAAGALLNAVHGNGAFRLFRRELERLRLTRQWYEFRERAFERIAIDWLEENGIPYERGERDV